ncbi:hypothetical protein BKA62DRAFT_15646 [Auriculariales sp. MPI-PUGE-AT-0066]|nr:hypothetical protein BKA62DRAFT_15646 [Auriculariales sp. MPI-PUGE-AT-0066]
MLPRSSTASTTGSGLNALGSAVLSTSPPASSVLATLEPVSRASDVDEADLGPSTSGSQAVSSTSSASAEFDSDGQQVPIEVHPTFSPHAPYPGRVKIIVEATTFWAHKDVLHFASPFFEAALSGNWSESSGQDPAKRTSISSVITISQPPPIPGDPAAMVGTPRSSTFSASVTQSNVTAEEDSSSWKSSRSNLHSKPLSSVQSDESSPDTDTDLDLFSGDPEDDPESQSDDERRRAQQQRLKSLQRLDGADKNPRTDRRKQRKSAPPPLRAARSQPVEAVVVLKEERATTFHDFLKFIYPNLDCTIAWNNVEGLFNIAQKLLVSSLQSACMNFLLTHAAGKPIKAMRIAELFEEEELYREASRFVLDNPEGWPEEELKTISQETLLKLEKKRNWFLERLIKLGLTNISAQYTCCPTCPDPSICARTLEDRWRAAYSASFRFGPAQPSMVYRYLRLLEGVSPQLTLTHLACQIHAKSWVATLFDRMFSLDTTVPMGPRVPGATSGPRRHFLYCSLKGEPPKRKTVALGI